MLTFDLLLMQNAIILSAFFFFLPSIHAVTPSPGCSNPPSEGELGYGLRPGKFTNFRRELLNTQRRTHRLHLPDDYNDDAPPPLMMYFHGWGGNHDSCGDTCSVTALEKGFVVVTMSGYGRSNWGSWKIGGSADSPGPLGPICTPETEGYCNDYERFGCDCSLADNCWWTTCYDSVEQVLSILDEVQETICFDLDQVWAVGCSNGGMFTFELARDQRSADRLKGIVPIVGLPHWGYSDGPLLDGIRMMGMWGDKDNVVPPISNTDDPDKTMDTDGGWYYTSSDKVMKDWTAEKGCVGEGQDPIDSDEDWGLGEFTDELSCTQGCTEKENGDRIVGCIFDGGHICEGDFIWDPVFKFMLDDPNSPTTSPSTVVTPCEENDTDEFLLRILNNGSASTQTCGWLKTGNDASNICQNNVAYTLDYSPAQDVCKETCDSCNCDYENSQTKFVKKIKNNGRIRLKTCDWLNKKSEKKKARICKQTKEGGGYKTPAEACPVTCKTTSCQAAQQNTNDIEFWHSY